MVNRIEGKGIRKEYREFILDDIDFKIPEGYITGFIGPNGSGKTTTMKIILGLIRKDSGQLLFDGKEKENGKLTDYSMNSRFGVLMDEPFLAKDWTMHDTDKAMSICYEDWDSGRFKSLLKDYSIGMDLKVKELSKGMKIKTMLAAALSHGADTLILDEPTGGLDPYMRDELTDILKDFVRNEKNTVLFSTHNTTDIEQVADYIVYIQDGKILYSGTKDDFMEEYLLIKGGNEELEKIDRNRLTGIKKTGLGFEAMIRRKDAGLLPEGLITENPNIDQIMIFNRRG